MQLKSVKLLSILGMWDAIANVESKRKPKVWVVRESDFSFHFKTFHSFNFKYHSNTILFNFKILTLTFFI